MFALAFNSYSIIALKAAELLFMYIASNVKSAELFKLR